MYEKFHLCGCRWNFFGEEVQNSNGTLKITFRTNNFAGNYRVKVWAQGMKNYVLNGFDYRGDGTRDWKLWDEETGHNIFYFIPDPFLSPAYDKKASVGIRYKNRQENDKKCLHGFVFYGKMIR